jgi:hypothetical protein
MKIMNLSPMGMETQSSKCSRLLGASPELECSKTNLLSDEFTIEASRVVASIKLCGEVIKPYSQASELSCEQAITHALPLENISTLVLIRNCSVQQINHQTIHTNLHRLERKRLKAERKIEEKKFWRAKKIQKAGNESQKESHILKAMKNELNDDDLKKGRAMVDEIIVMDMEEPKILLYTPQQEREFLRLQDDKDLKKIKEYINGMLSKPEVHVGMILGENMKTYF